ncbi:hypothetical protein DRE_03473 [Drechslerella stenobrocha 248]|uniref:SHSP domain-containing protein n=1 Tax=Drechslerella stenobrocha 248 TaxID=1043628 RepID=W7HUE8_9PEZI|nr:hypothetical protein DRE_03473 [Drechslerella stenobrocha 248]
MTKNYQDKPEAEKMASPNPQSPQEQVMEFINTLGEHMEEAFSQATSSQTEKGDHYPTSEANAPAQSSNPPTYDQTEKSGESSANASREPQERCDRDQSRSSGSKGREQDQNPWVNMVNMFTEGLANSAPQHPGMPFGPGAWRGRGRGFGFGGRGSYHGPWGWNSNNRGPWGRHHHRGWQRDSTGGCEQDFTPAVDLFDTPDSFVVHIALPGALKQDLGINYDFDSAELQISGVVHRPGDEEFQKYLVDGERRVGAFERKVKLESNGKTVPVDADGITAKLENGLLEVTVPKLRKADEPEKKKIIIE